MPVKNGNDINQAITRTASDISYCTKIKKNALRDSKDVFAAIKS
jgi:hypothetical protein